MKNIIKIIILLSFLMVIFILLKKIKNNDNDTEEPETKPLTAPITNVEIQVQPPRERGGN